MAQQLHFQRTRGGVTHCNFGSPLFLATVSSYANTLLSLYEMRVASTLYAAFCWYAVCDYVLGTYFFLFPCLQLPYDHAFAGRDMTTVCDFST